MFTRAQRGCVIQRCQNKNPRNELGPGDVSDVESWVPASEWESWDSEVGEGRRISALWAPRVGWVESWRRKSSQHRKIVSLSPHVEKPLNSKKWIKVFYLNQFREFRVFGFLYMFMNILLTLCLSSVESTEKDIETRLTKVWTAINRLSIIWKSDLTDKMKRSFFQAAVTSMLLYGCTTWTLTKRLEKKLGGNYIRMLRAILNQSWRQHPTRHQLYGHLPPITKTIQVRQTRHAGHCWRSRDELIRDVLLWTPTHGRAKAGRPARTYIQQLCEDTGCCPEDLPKAMNDREKWRERVSDIRATSATWWWWWWWCLFHKSVSWVCYSTYVCACVCDESGCNVMEMNAVTWVKIHIKPVCSWVSLIPLRIVPIRHPTILSQSIGKFYDRLGSLISVWQLI